MELKSNTHIVAHHFESGEQAFESSKLGMWIFLVTEIMLFGGLFVGYIMYHNLYPETFHHASQLLNWTMGGINTVVLICSSYTMAMAANRVMFNKQKQAVWLMLLTLLFAAIFMVIKYFEYSHKIHEGQLPGGLYHFEGLEDPKAPLFFTLYFMMTGLHGIHVLVGMGLIAWVMLGTMKNKFDMVYHTPVELTTIYWHLVDLIWIYLFPMLYLVA